MTASRGPHAASRPRRRAGSARRRSAASGGQPQRGVQRAGAETGRHERQHVGAGGGALGQQLGVRRRGLGHEPVGQRPGRHVPAGRLEREARPAAGPARPSARRSAWARAPPAVRRGPGRRRAGGHGPEHAPPGPVGLLGRPVGEELAAARPRSKVPDAGRGEPPVTRRRAAPGRSPSTSISICSSPGSASSSASSTSASSRRARSAAASSRNGSSTTVEKPCGGSPSASNGRRRAGRCPSRRRTSSASSGHGVDQLDGVGAGEAHRTVAGQQDRLVGDRKHGGETDAEPADRMRDPARRARRAWPRPAGWPARRRRLRRGERRCSRPPALRRRRTGSG